MALSINGKTFALAADGSFSYPWALTQEGENDLGLVAADSAGNITSINKTVVRDTVAPVAPAVNLPVFTSDQNIQVGISVEKLSFLYLSVTKDGAAQPYINNQSYGQTSDGTMFVSLHQLVGSSNLVTAASYVITFKSVDGAGNSTSVTRTVQFQPPSAAEPSLTLNRPVLNPGNTAYISGQTEQGAVVSATLDPGTTGETAVYGIIVNPDGSFGFTVQVPTVGTHSVKVDVNSLARTISQVVQFYYSFNPIVLQMVPSQTVPNQLTRVDVVPGQVSMDVQPGTFPNGATVKASILDPNSVLSPDNNLKIAGSVYDFSATSTLAVPITATFHYDPAQLNGIDESTLGVYYFNPKTLNWEKISGSIVDKVNHTVTAKLYHFSPYALQGSAPPLPGTPKIFNPSVTNSYASPPD